MNPVVPSGYSHNFHAVVLAKDQPEYVPLPAVVNREGLVVTEWELDTDELERILRGARVRLRIQTFGHPVQPIQLDVMVPEGGMRGDPS
jgi:hypothetical protein